MLWVYINNQGTAQCVVNMGNKIRQGDAVKLFIVFPQEASDFISLEDQLVSYIKPGATEYTAVNVSCEEASFEFTLGNPSQANSFFTGGTTYDGWLITLPEDATSFDGNGGHVGVSLVVENSMSESVHTEVIDFYVEPTYGKKWNKMTATDYATLLKLIKSSNVFNVGVKDSLAFLDLYRGESSAICFVYNDATYLAFITYDEDSGDTKQTILSVSADNLLFSQSRTYSDGEWGEWTDEALLDEITSIVRTSGTGAAGTDDTYTIYTKANPEGIATFTVHNGRDGVDGLTPYINPSDKHWMIGNVDTGVVAEGVDGIDGDDAGFANPNATAEASSLPSGAPPTVIATVSASGPDTAKEFQFSFTFGIPKGADGVITEANGLIGFQIDSQGHLIMTYSGGDAPNLSINSQGHLIYTY